MFLKAFRINHYRSINTEIRLDTLKGLSIVGPNNCGKTNILKAIKTFFSAKDDDESYSYKRDIPFGSKAGQSSFVATFGFDGNDPLQEAFTELFGMVEITSQDLNEVNLYLTFSSKGNPSYGFFKGVKRKEGVKSNAYTYVERKLVEKLLNSFECVYVPSAKSVEQLYNSLVIPYLRKVASEKLSDSLDILKAGLKEISNSVDMELNTCGINGYTTEFKVPDNQLEKIISGFEFTITDTEETDIFNKGMGIQCTALFSTFSWISKKKKEEQKDLIWLIEEPESFLHPELTRSCNQILDNLKDHAYVVVTTHSLSFVHQDTRKVIGVEKNDGKTLAVKYKTYPEATKKIRESLGVKFSDFFNLDRYNIFVEGPTDKEYFSWFLETTSNDPQLGTQWPELRKAKFEDFGGVKFLTGFLRANYQFLHNETICISVFDGDKEGSDERQNIQSYIRGKLQLSFEPNRDFISIRSGFSIEGLFCDEWIINLYSQSPSWFENYSIDASGTIEPFKVVDTKKRQFLNHMCSQEKDGEYNWAKHWIPVCNALESAIIAKNQ